jgi:peptide/nickel transport system substrate-binding protein
VTPIGTPGSDSTPPLSRRRLLKLAATTGAAAAAVPLLDACSSGSGTSPASSPAGSATPRRGGDLRVAILGGSSSDTLDAGREVTQPDALRVMALYNGLVRLNSRAQVVNDLAQELTPNADATQWDIRLVPGVTFHNGKPLTADDVIFSLRRIMNPKSPLNGASALAPLDPSGMKALDSRTVRLKMRTPYASFPEQISAVYNFGVVPVGYDPKNPVGTGPFAFQSFTPGQQSVFVRNKNYFQSGRPYLDSLTIIDSFASDTAAFNALQGGEVDAYAQATLSLASQAASSGLVAVTSLPGQWTPFTMRVDQPPFSDVRVRQAFRLMVDRPQLIKISLSGFGSVGNDIFSQWDPAYNRSLVRHQDIAQAKSLLARAGHSNLTVGLTTADIAPGVLQAAQVFAQQASQAGVTVNIKKVPVGTFYGPNYLHWNFAQDFWAYSPYLSQVAQGMLTTSPFNETRWNDPAYVSLYKQANATVDKTKQAELIHQMQLIDFNRGGYIIAAYNKQLDLLSPKVRGVRPSGTGIPLGNAEWASLWLSK